MAVLPAAWCLNPYLSDKITVCFFRTWTGYQCPFCGLTRALAAAVHGNWHLALRYHPFWWIVPLLMCQIAVMLLSDALIGSDLFGIIKQIASRLKWRWLILGISAIWIMRILADRLY